LRLGSAADEALAHGKPSEEHEVERDA
jgi:hypothetical protein